MATCPTRSGCGSALTTSWTALAPARTRKTAISASISSRWLAWRAALGDAAAISLPQTARKQSSATQKSSVQTERQDALRRFIWEQNASVLAERLWSWAERDRACMADLKIWASSSKAVDDPKALRAAIDAVLPRRNGYLDWRRSNDYARQGSAVMELLRPWISRDAATARELCEHALRRLFKVAEQSDDSLGGIGGLIQDLMGLLIETLRTAAPPASWIDRWFKLMDADPWGLWNEPAVLEAAGPEAQAATRNAPARTGTRGGSARARPRPGALRHF